MTTIAFDGKTLAADTQITYGGKFPGFGRKIKRLANGLVIATAGTVGPALKLELAAAGKYDLTKLNKKELEATEALYVTPDGVAKYFESSLPGYIELDDPIYAMGAGWVIAWSAMKRGANAKEAVQMAAAGNVFTNDVIDTYDLATQAFTLAEFPRY